VGGQTSVLSSTSVGTTVTTVLAADTNRRGAILTNTSATATVYGAFGANPTATLNAFALAPKGQWRVDPEFIQSDLRMLASAASTTVNYNTIAIP
jgi:hypothetical protein